MLSNEELSKKILVGLVERVTVISNDMTEKYSDLARIDTGATMSSIDTQIVKDLKLGPVIKARSVRSANGLTIRPMIEVNIKLHGKEMRSNFTVTDRSKMKYKILIGTNILKEGFLVNPDYSL